MRSTVLSLALLALAALPPGCGGAGSGGTEPPRSAGSERAVRGPKRPEPPPLIAPPPAYGNKIVMAKAERSVSED